MNFPSGRLAGYLGKRAGRFTASLSLSGMQTLQLDELLAMADEPWRQQWQRLSLGFSTSRGDPLLRELIAQQYPALSGQNILTFAGAQEATFCVLTALLKAGDHVLGLTPVFEPLSLLPESLGVDLQAFPLEPETSGWVLDMDAFIGQIRPQTRMVIINFPHNPTGANITLAELNRLAGICEKQGIWLLSDEVFRGLEFEQSECLPTVASLYPRGISINVMSKAWGLGGVRLGWVASQDQDLLGRLLEIKQYLSICNGRTDEMLAQLALQNSARILASQCNLLRENKKLLQDFLQRMDQACQELVRCPDVRAGCVAFPGLAGEYPVGDIADALLEKFAVMLLPADCFLSQENRFRLGFGQNNFPEVLKKLEILLLEMVA